MSDTRMRQRFVLDPADLQENARTPVRVTVGNSAAVAGLVAAEYVRVGVGARWRWNGNPRRLRVLVYAEWAGGGNNRVALRVTSANGTVMEDIWSSVVPSSVGFHWVTFPLLPAGGTASQNIIELFVPAQHAQAAGGAPFGVFPVMVECDYPMTKAAALTGNIWWMLGDSNTVGGVAPIQAQQGFAGRMKRRAAFGGVDKRIYVDAWGYRMLRDVANGAAAQLAYAQYIAGFASQGTIEKIFVLLGTNDWLPGGWGHAAFGTGLTGLLSYIKAQPATANAQVNCIPPFISTGREGVGGSSSTMDQYRDAVQPAVDASGNANAIRRDGKAMTTAANISTDGVHLLELGSIDVQAILQSY